jgi:hypothetical protein
MPRGGMGGAEGRQARQGYVGERDRHQLEAERLSALARNQQRRRGREHCREQPEHDLGPVAKHRVVDHRSQMERDHDEDQSEQSALALTNATPKSCQAPGSYAASISGRPTWGRGPPTSPAKYLAEVSLSMRGSGFVRATAFRPKQ